MFIAALNHSYDHKQRTGLWYFAKRNETKRNGTLRNGTLRNETKRNGTLRNGTLRNGYTSANAPKFYALATKP